MAHLITIGNSKGVRIPKNLIEQAQIQDKELEFSVLPEGILIRPVKKVREGWAEKFSLLAQQPTTNEDKEWLESEIGEPQAEADWTW